MLVAIILRDLGISVKQPGCAPRIINDRGSPKPNPEQFTTVRTFSARWNASIKSTNVYSLMCPPLSTNRRRRYAQYTGELTTKVLYRTPHFTPCSNALVEESSVDGTNSRNPSKCPLYASPTALVSRYSPGGFSRISIPSTSAIPAAGCAAAIVLK